MDLHLSEIANILLSKYKRASAFISLSLNVMGDYVFAECSNLKNIDIPKNIYRIGDGAFMNCYSLGRITLPKDLGLIGSRAFSFCSNLSTIHLPSSLRDIRPFAFSNSALESVTADSDGETPVVPGLLFYCCRVSEGAFYHCNSLLSVEMPYNTCI